MKSNRSVYAMAVAALLLCAPALADVQVSITITGDPQEMLQVLQQLVDSGMVGGEGDSKLYIHSIESGDETAECMAEEETAEAPALAISGVMVTPEAVQPGAAVLVQVTLSDPESVVDTMAVLFENTEQPLADLYDNGMNGDAQARDGVWSTMLNIPADMAAGEYTFVVQAYGPNGNRVVAPNAQGESVPLNAAVTVAVQQQ